MSTIQNIPKQAIARVTAMQWVKYALIVIIIGAVISATGFIMPGSPQLAFGLNVVLFLLAGVWFWLRVKPLASLRRHFTSYLITITVLSFIFLVGGYVAGYFLFNKFFTALFCKLDFIDTMAPAAIAAMVPLFFDLAFESAVNIPPRVYKKWTYPEKPLVMDMDNIDLSNFAVVTFVFSKKDGENSNSNFQSKAPYTIRLGDLFYFFVQEWNYKNPGNTIDFLDVNGKPFGWNFTLKKPWWPAKTYLDPDLSVKENKIKVNTIIKTERVHQNISIEKMQ
jgi:general stress protein CsbA